MARIALLQLPAAWQEPQRQWALVEALLNRAGPVDLALLPETALTGYVSPTGLFDPTELAEPVDGPTVARLQETAARHRCALVGPLVESSTAGFFNSMVAVDASGQRVGVYRKRHPWYPEQWAAAGAHPHPLWDLAGLRVSVAICFDLHFVGDEAAATLTSCDLLLAPTAWVDDNGVDGRGPLLSNLARRYGIAIANANWGLGTPQVEGQGHSRFVGPDGSTLVELARAPGVLVADLHPRARAAPAADGETDRREP